MEWLIFLGILFLGFLGGLGWIRWKEQKYLKKPTREAISKDLMLELEREKKDALRRKREFEEKLKK